MSDTKSISNRVTLPLLQRLTTIYKSWHTLMPTLPKTARYTLGEKIDRCFLEMMESIYTASFLQKEQKLIHLQEAMIKLDLLKFFLQITWEIKSLDTKKYILLSEQLEEIGRMLGGWTRQVTPK